MLGIIFEQNAGSFNRKCFESVVQKVRKLEAKPGEVIPLRLDRISDPDSLHPLKPSDTFERGRGAGNVWVIFTPWGIKVVIETRDLGHAGEYGFAFSDVPWTFRQDGAWQTVDAPGRLIYTRPDMKIDQQWQEVLYNLD